ncbi:syntaxin-18-like [Varroa jacobsoni]|uniref:t-SNARE coiled-coil homology domain-containing protein n=1 Tax=Varroa destructor TaxID=109461 RepID=A0A7M7JK99_VARDE|nr:syntaxin-18-like [Varroa destructor]XP_022692045.1 syntaxin-18-like [Varroa jacobsoni]
MDLTLNFKSLVKTLRSRSKALDNNNDSHLNRSTPRDQRETRFNKNVKDIIGAISKMKSFLLAHRKDYIDQHFIMYNVSKMSDIEREEIDQVTQKFIVKYKQIIAQLRKEINTSATTPQQAEHQTFVIAMTEGYLRFVGRIWSEQRSLRMKRDSKMRAFGSLTGNHLVKKLAGTAVEGSNEIESAYEELSKTFSKRVSHDTDSPETKVVFKEPCDLTDTETSYPNDEQNALNEFRSVRITSEDVQMLEQENTRLYDELNSMAEQVKQIEGRVAEISELQKEFTEKVIEQEDDVKRIASTMFAATENVKGANEQLRQAMQSHAGLRVAILFSLIVLSCSLLFLDWYNP